MSFDNYYPNRKDKRKPYKKAKAVDRTCRNHGSCPYCLGNREISKRKVELAMSEEIKAFDVLKNSGEVCLACLQPTCDCLKEFEERELPGIEHYQKLSR